MSACSFGTTFRPARLPTVLAGLVLGFGLVWLRPAAEPPRPDPDKPLEPDHAARMARGLDLFKKSVGPLLAAKCVRCHGGRATESGFDLTERAGLLKGGDSG